jgi:hypothetical protein
MFLPMVVLVAPAYSANVQAKFEWQGFTWLVKSGGPMGPGSNQWDPANVWVDSKGFLHLKIAKRNGQWTCAEIWTNQNLGFGTYQCQVEGPIGKLDPNIVFSMFSYAGPDGVNEIDIEYAKWGNAIEKNAWWTVYPNDAQGAKDSLGFELGLKGAYSTSRYSWSKIGVHYWMLGGRQPLSSSKNLLKEWNYAPQDAGHHIPQSPMPLHFNLWLFEGKPPADGKPVEIVVHGFSKK